MSDMDKAIFDSKHALPNKLIKEDGTVTDFAGNVVIGAVDAYESKSALPNKWLNPDGTYSTLNEIVASMLDNDIFVIVDELPETGETDKIYLVTQDGKLIEYLWVNNEWDPVGMVEFDITNYYTKNETTQLISGAITTAEEYSDTNFLKKNNTTAYTPTADYHPATKAYVDETQIFEYTINDKSAEGLATLTTVYNLNKTKDVVLVTKYGDTSSGNNIMTLTFNIPKQYFLTHNNYTPTLYYIKPYNNTNNYSQFLSQSIYIGITLSGDTVTDCRAYTGNNGGNSGRIYYLDPTIDYSNPYTPLYNGSPATKKYVDDAITTNITNVLGGSY